MKYLDYRIINKIALSILIIGLLNIFNILKKGSLVSLLDNENLTKGLNSSGLIQLDMNIMKIVIIISILLFLIVNYIESRLYNKNEKRITHSLEYELLIGFSLIGLILILISNDIIFLYLGIELYSFSIYILIVIKETISIRRISIIYLILSSLVSAIILYVFSRLYLEYGTINYNNIIDIIKMNEGQKDTYIIYILTIAFLFKLGLIPFVFWLIRLYSDLDKRILWYQLLIPKLVYFFILLKFININSYFVTSDNITIFTPHSQIMSGYYILYLLAISTIIVGCIGGLFQTKDNILLSYSSILNIGYIILALSLILINYEENPDYKIIDKVILEIENLWILYQYFFIYFINLIGLFAVLFIYRRSSNIFKLKNFLKQPFFFICFFILILSLIGIPPLSGFLSKFYYFFILLNSSKLNTISLIIFIISTLISSFFYLKFIFSSSSDSYMTLINSEEVNLILLNKNDFSSLILSFSTLLVILYPFYLSSLLPFFYILTP